MLNKSVETRVVEIFSVREGWDNFLLLQFLQLRRISIRECNFAQLPRFLHDTYDFVPRTNELEKKWYEIFNIYRGKINFFKVKYVEGVIDLPPA